MNAKYYKCYYTCGEYDDYQIIDVFITSNLNKAKRWSSKFNKIIKKWKLYYSQYEGNKYSFPWIEDEYVDKYYDRWSSLKRINRASYEEIEFR